MVILLIVLDVIGWSAEISLFVGCIAGLILYAKYIPWKEIWRHLGNGTFDGVGALFNTAAVVGFGSLVQATPAFKTIINAMTSLGGSPLIASALAVTTLAGVCGSGSGGLGIVMPIIKNTFGSSVNLQALHRVCDVSSLCLDSLPHNGLVVSVLNVTENDHRHSYFPIFILTVVIPICTLVFLIAIFYAIGMA